MSVVQKNILPLDPSSSIPDAELEIAIADVVVEVENDATERAAVVALVIALSLTKENADDPLEFEPTPNEKPKNYQGEDLTSFVF